MVIDTENSQFTFTPFFGVVATKSWITLHAGEIIGMGSKTTYDRNGEIVSYEESPSGLKIKVDT